MKLSEIKKILDTVETVQFRLEDNTWVPEHFHVTEIGLVSKHFIDCGGTVRTEKAVSFQLWDANDYDHRLKPKKLQGIISLAEKVLETGDQEIEVEYQSGTIGKYDLSFDGTSFVLLNKRTACLASDSCGTQKARKQLSDLKTSTCSPDGGCC